MVAPISDDAEEARIAELVKRLIRDRGYTHDSFANEVGVSAGRVSQWATNRGGVPPERAMKVAGLLETTPDQISLSWRNLRDEFLASQSERLDSSIILSAFQEAVTKYEALGQHRKSFSPLSNPDHAELFALAIAAHLAPATDEGTNQVTVEVWNGSTRKNPERSGASGEDRKPEAGQESEPARSRTRKSA